MFRFLLKILLEENVKCFFLKLIVNYLLIELIEYLG